MTKKIFPFVLSSLLAASTVHSQTTAMDFTMNDCNGNMHHLYSELDSNNVIIMEFFHTCPSCVDAANDIKPMFQQLKAKYGNKVRFFATPEDDTYSCTSVLNWVNSNGFSSIITPFDSGGVQTAYYGGMGMPTIAVAAGSTHKILYVCNQTVSWATSDTGLIHTAISNFLDSTFAGVNELQNIVSVNISPNPTSESFLVSLDIKEPGTLKLEIFNVAGQKTIELTEEKIQSGMWSKSFSPTLTNGVYFLQGSLNGKTFREKITVQH